MSATPRASAWHLPSGWQVTVPAVVLMLTPGVLAFGPVFAGPQGWIAGAGGAALGLGVAFFAAARRWGWLEVLATTIAVYLLFGGALALPKTTIAGVVPTLDTLQRLIPLTAYAWRDLLTVSLPASLFTGPAVVPYLAAFAASVIGATVALRTRRPAWAVLPFGALLVVGILWGLHRAPLALALGAALGAVAIAWLAWQARQRATSDASELLGLEGMSSVAKPSWLGAVGIVALASACAVGSGFVLPTPQRFVLRDVVQPPLDMQQYASPLTMFRYLERDLHDETLFTVSGLPTGARVRLAAMDAYDGVVYNIDASSASYIRVGRTIGQELELTGEPVTVDVTVGKYAGVWLPGGGDLRGLSFTRSTFDETVYYNRSSGTALTTAGVAEGDTYQVSVVPETKTSTAQLAGRGFAQVALPNVFGVPEVIATKSQQFVGNASTPYEQVAKLVEELRTRGFYSDGTDGRSRAGHTAERLGALLADKVQMIGDDEQYAVAMALMCRQLGIPARVVLGFYPDASQTPSGTWTITGAQAHVWVEVAFDGAGWVAFDPTPDRAKTPNTEVPQPKSDPKPQVLPPPDRQNDTADDNKDIIDDARDKKTDGRPAWLQILTTIGAAVGGAALVGSPFVTVIALKRRRRKQRFADEVLSDRAHGGWLEVLDRATDLGTTVEARTTRREMSSQIEAAFPEAGSVAIAERIDAGVFSESEPTTEDVAAMWTEVDAVLGRMAGAVPWWRRWLSTVSPRSLGVTRQGFAAAMSPAKTAARVTTAARAGLDRMRTFRGRDPR